MVKKQYIKKSDSRSALRTYIWNKNNGTVFPDFSYDAVIKMVNDDPIARGAITHFVDKCMEGSSVIINKTTRNVDDGEWNRLQEKYQFRTEILRKLFLQLKLFNNSFIENVKTLEGHTKSLNVLDSQVIEPITEANGDPKKSGAAYISNIPNPTNGQYPSWTKEEITWIKVGDRSVGYAPVDLKALWENLCIKSWVKRYVGWLWETGQYRLIYNFKNPRDGDVEDFIAYGRKHDDNFKSPFMTSGELDVKLLRDMREQESIVEFIKWLDSQTLVLLRIPPIDAGIPDASGRSNSDAQSNNLNTHVTSIKKVIEDKINYDLFPKINKNNSLIKFAPSDRFAFKQAIENCQIMQSMGFSQEAMDEYLENAGIYFKSTTFKPEIQLTQVSNPRKLDTMPSRIGKGTGESSAKIGTGQQSTTRSDQLVKQ